MKQKKQYPWAVRLAKAAEGMSALPNGAGLAVQRFLQETAPSVLLGAALVSGQPCLLWNSEVILDQVLDGYDNRFQASCGTVLNILRAKIKCDEHGVYDMLFRLLIEPFALMNQSTAFYPAGGIHPSTTHE